MSSVVDKGGSGDADAMLGYSDQAIKLQKEIYDQTRSDYEPYREAGTTALSALMQKLGLSGDSTSSDYGSLMKTYDASNILEDDPGYQFRMDEGTKAIERQLAASGKYLTPEASKALDEYGQNYASNEYSNAYNRNQQNTDTIYNRLAGITGTGQSATGSTATAASNYANSTSDLYTQQGNAVTAAAEAARNRGSSFFNTMAGLGGSLGSAAIISDERLKENIKPIGEENGHNIYEFNYKDDPEKIKFIGVMAQEVQKKNPDAVVKKDDGFLAVNYDKIGVNFRRAD